MSILSFYCCSHTCSIALSLTEPSNLIVANKDNFLKYEYSNEVSSHKEMLCTFYSDPGAYTTKVISAYCEMWNGTTVSFSITMQVAVSMLEQVINMFNNWLSTVLSITLTMKNHNG